MNSHGSHQMTRWQRDRRAFIEHRIYWHGLIGLADLMDVMEISRAQASKDLNGYITDHPDHLHYDKSARTYVMGQAFEAHYLSIDPGEYLADLAAIARGAAVPKSDWVVDLPDILAPATPMRGLTRLPCAMFLWPAHSTAASLSAINRCHLQSRRNARSHHMAWRMTDSVGTRGLGVCEMVSSRISCWDVSWPAPLVSRPMSIPVQTKTGRKL